MPIQAVSDTSLTRAVEITKAALSSEAGTWVNHADIVAKFIETVAVKLEQLREGDPPARR
jgi:hypothetical protein